MLNTTRLPLRMLAFGYVAYANGQGLPQDLVQAYMWFDLSAGRGYKDAIQVRETVSRRMTEAQIAEAQKLSRDWKPASKPPALLLQ